MFVTPQLKDSVGKILQSLGEHSQWLSACAALGSDWTGDKTRVLAAERALHVAVELATDAANQVIDALVMRDPGGYADIIRVLMEEQVVDKAWFHKFEGAIAFRQRLIHDYIEIEDLEVVDAVSQYAPLFPVYIEKIKAYLEM